MKHVSTCTHAQLGEEEKKKILKSVVSIYWNRGEAKPRRPRLLCRSARRWTWSVQALIYTQELFSSSLLLEYTALHASWTELHSHHNAQSHSSSPHASMVQTSKHSTWDDSDLVSISFFCPLNSVWTLTSITCPVCVIYAVNRVCCSTCVFC